MLLHLPRGERGYYCTIKRIKEKECSLCISYIVISLPHNTAYCASPSGRASSSSSEKELKGFKKGCFLVHTTHIIPQQVNIASRVRSAFLTFQRNQNRPRGGRTRTTTARRRKNNNNTGAAAPIYLYVTLFFSDFSCCYSTTEKEGGAHLFLLLPPIFTYE